MSIWKFDMHAGLRVGCSIKVIIERDVKKGEIGPCVIEKEVERKSVLGTVYPSLGPREWSPRRAFPEGFVKWADIGRLDRLTITNNGLDVARLMVNWKPGAFGLLEVGSVFWEYFVKQS